MPQIRGKCPKCQSEVERRTINGAPDPTCPACGAKLENVQEI